MPYKYFLNEVVRKLEFERLSTPIFMMIRTPGAQCRKQKVKEMYKLFLAQHQSEPDSRFYLKDLSKSYADFST